MKPHKATGHFDRSGNMIHHHDRLLVDPRPVQPLLQPRREAYTGRTAYVLWAGQKWTLWFGGRETESINHYGAERLQIIAPKRARKTA